MSSRALRKAQREKEEQDRLKHLQDEVEESDEEAAAGYVAPQKSAFALLDEHDEDEDESDDATDEPEIVAVSKTEPLSNPSQKKKKKRKNKGKSKGTTEPEPIGATSQLDEIDVALKQLSTEGNTTFSGSTAAGINADSDRANKLLSIDTNHLHAQNEMRRLFGRAAFEEQNDDQPPEPAAAGGNRRQQRRIQQVGLAQALRGQRNGGRPGGFSTIALRRNIFIQGKEEWPAATTGGLGMEVEEKRADGTVLYRFIHNRSYQDVQAQFESCVESMDPNRMVVLLQHNPYHISTLLQVSEIAKQERDHSTSGDLLERALFSFGRAVHSTFAKSLSEGKARLDFRRAENRELWLASWRYMQNLSMRGTWRTVYEWAKLLLSLSPEDDPYALWLVLDQYALRSRQDLDFLNLSSDPLLQKAHFSMPNVQLSRGMAEIRAGNAGKGKQALFTAVGKYPWIVARLLQELNLDAPPAIWGKEARSEKEKLYSELYATRAKDLWNTPEMSHLLTEIASAVPAETQTAAIDADEITQSEARHVLLSDNPSLIALVPRTYTAQLTSAADPIPPDDAFMSYLQRQLGDTNSGRAVSVEESLSELQGLQRFFTRMFPWYAQARSGAMDNPANGNDNENVAGDGEEENQPNLDADEIERIIQESGISREEFAQRAHRMAQIQHGLLGQLRDSNPEELQRMIAESDHPTAETTTERIEHDDPEHHLHARVEDAPDDHD